MEKVVIFGPKSAILSQKQAISRISRDEFWRTFGGLLEEMTVFQPRRASYERISHPVEQGALQEE